MGLLFAGERRIARLLLLLMLLVAAEGTVLRTAQLLSGVPVAAVSSLELSAGVSFQGALSPPKCVVGLPVEVTGLPGGAALSGSLCEA